MTLQSGKMLENGSLITRLSFEGAGQTHPLIDPWQTGSGMSFSQTGGTLQIVSGTTAKAETVLACKTTFGGALLLSAKIIASQRIVNQRLHIELCDVIGRNLPYTSTAASCTVSFPTSPSPVPFPFDSGSIGQTFTLTALGGVLDIPGEYAISAVNTVARTVTFTVASWAASNTGFLTITGRSLLRMEYDGATATSAKWYVGRAGYRSATNAITINTTATPGHVFRSLTDGVGARVFDGLIASNTGTQFTARGSDIANLPDPQTPLTLIIRVLNDSSAPATTTTFTVGFVEVEEYVNQKVFTTPAAGESPAPATITGSVSITGTATVGGVAAHAAAISGSPVRLGARALSADYTAVATGQTADLKSDLVGGLIVRPYNIPESSWQFAVAAAGILNTTTAVTMKAAAAAGIRNYLTSVTIMAEALGAATEVAIRDGASGTVIWRIKIPTSGLPATNFEFTVPLRGTAATLMEVVTLTASVTGAVYVNAQGFIAP